MFGCLEVKNSRLFVGGCDARSIADKFGTPVYVLDMGCVKKTCEKIERVLKSEYENHIACYASKAFCVTGIYGLMSKIGFGADVVSGGELYTALSGGMPANRIYFHGNNKTEAEIKYAIDSGVGCFVIDSIHEAELIAKYAKLPQNALIRVNPGVEAHTHRYIQTTTVDSKFGFSIADGTAKEVINTLLDNDKINFVGLSCHIGSQIFEQRSFEIAIDKMTAFMSELKREGIKVERLDLGGGFGIRYIDGDNPDPVEQYIKNVCRYLKSALKSNGLDMPQLIVEPGRSIVGEAGITLYTVGAIKQIRGVKTYAAVDGGMFENPRPSLYGAQYTACVADRADYPQEATYSIAGKCCESGDVLINDIRLPVLKSGDVLAVFSTGAYHYSMASNYNRNAVPPVVAVMNGQADYLVKPQTFKDIARNDNIPKFLEDIK